MSEFNDDEPKVWRMEYRNSYPWIKTVFYVQAVTLNEAIEEGNKEILGLSRTGTWVDNQRTKNLRRTLEIMEKK